MYTDSETIEQKLDFGFSFVKLQIVMYVCMSIFHCWPLDQPCIHGFLKSTIKICLAYELNRVN